MCIRDRNLSDVAVVEKAPKVEGRSIGMVPVSYTHLDVYKRQGGDKAPQGSGD